MGSNRRWLALLVVAFGTFMTYLDNNVVNVALPSIQRDLHLSMSGLEWIASAYIVVFAGLLLVGGRMADVFGKRGAFLVGLGIFTTASLAAGLAASQDMLIGARVAQGIGAALLTPVSLALLPTIFPNPRERAMAVGIWGGVGALALAVGPFTGGYVSQHIDWGWIFLINVPLGVLTAALALLTLPGGAKDTDPTATALESTAIASTAIASTAIASTAIEATASGSADGTRRRLDLPGLITSSIALFALTYALIEGESRGWTSTLILGAFAITAVAGAAFIAIETRTSEPMVDLSFFRLRAFSGGLAAMALWAFGVFGVYFYTAIFLQNVLGFSPTKAGAAFVPMALVMAVVAALAPRIETRLGTARTVALALGLMAVAIGVLSMVGEGLGYLALLPWFLLFGMGGGLLIPLTNVIIGVLPPARAGLASGMLNVSREVSGLLGITVLGAIISAREHAVAGPAMHAFLSGYQLSLIVAALLIALGVPVSLLALRRVTPAQSPVPRPELAPESV